MRVRHGLTRIGRGFVGIIFLVSLFFTIRLPQHVLAATPVQSSTGNTGSGSKGGTSASASFSTTPAINDLLIVVCSGSAAVTFSLTQTGFTAAKNQSGISSQAIFYKVSAGNETTITCSAGATTMGIVIQIYEYSGIENVNPLDAVNTTASSGTGTSASSGTVTTLDANDLLFAATTTDNTTGGVSFSPPWTNSFTQENTNTDSYKSGTGKNATTTYVGSAAADLSVSSAGSYSSGVTATSGSWVGQIVAFKIAPAVAFGGDIVTTSTGTSVSSPSVSMSSTSMGFTCQTSTGTLPASGQSIRVTNTTPTDNLGWTLTIAASSPSWSDGAGDSYAYNNSAGSPAGCTSGQLSIVPTSETITPESSPEHGCTNTGISPLGATTGFTGTTPITIASANSSASYYCYWDINGIGLSQKIPATQHSGSYSLSLTLTLTAL